MEDDVEGNWLCVTCIGEEYLRREVQDSPAQTCAYCGNSAAGLTIEAAAEYVSAALDEHYEQTPTEPSDYQRVTEGPDGWERSGDPLPYVIGDMMAIEPEPAQHIHQVLEAGQGRWDDDEDLDERPYDLSAHYELAAVDDGQLRAEWAHLEATLQSESRFFNRAAQEVFASLFKDLEAHQSVVGSPVLTIGPGTRVTHLSRARVFQSIEPLREALARPDIHIGPPPFRLAAAGRMNPRGVSVFYGATSDDVARSEVRPPVSSWVVIGQFEILRPLRILNVEALRQLYVAGSVFDPTHADNLRRAKFLERVSHRITKPVLPDDEPFDYLTTQAIADYLASEIEPSFDGIMFPSVQLPDRGENVALFHKAARVEELDLPPGTTIEAIVASAGEHKNRRSMYWVSEESPKVGPPSTDEPGEIMGIGSLHLALEPSDYREVTLRVDADNLAVHEIGSVEYFAERKAVVRHRSRGASPPFGSTS